MRCFLHVDIFTVRNDGKGKVLLLNDSFLLLFFLCCWKCLLLQVLFEIV